MSIVAIKNEKDKIKIGADTQVTKGQSSNQITKLVKHD